MNSVSKMRPSSRLPRQKRFLTLKVPRGTRLCGTDQTWGFEFPDAADCSTRPALIMNEGGA